MDTAGLYTPVMGNNFGQTQTEEYSYVHGGITSAEKYLLASKLKKDTLRRQLLPPSVTNKNYIQPNQRLDQSHRRANLNERDNGTANRSNRKSGMNAHNYTNPLGVQQRRNNQNTVNSLPHPVDKKELFVNYRFRPNNIDGLGDAGKAYFKSDSSVSGTFTIHSSNDEDNTEEEEDELDLLAEAVKQPRKSTPISLNTSSQSNGSSEGERAEYDVDEYALNYRKSNLSRPKMRHNRKYVTTECGREDNLFTVRNNTLPVPRTTCLKQHSNTRSIHKPKTTPLGDTMNVTESAMFDLQSPTNDYSKDTTFVSNRHVTFCSDGSKEQPLPALGFSNVAADEDMVTYTAYIRSGTFGIVPPEGWLNDLKNRSRRQLSGIQRQCHCTIEFIDQSALHRGLLVHPMRITGRSRREIIRCLTALPEWIERLLITSNAQHWQTQL